MDTDEGSEGRAPIPHATHEERGMWPSSWDLHAAAAGNTGGDCSEWIDAAGVTHRDCFTLKPSAQGVNPLHVSSSMKDIQGTIPTIHLTLGTVDLRDEMIDDNGVMACTPEDNIGTTE